MAGGQRGPASRAALPASRVALHSRQRQVLHPHPRSSCLRKGTPLASRVAQGVSGPSSSCVWNPRVFADDARGWHPDIPITDQQCHILQGAPQMSPPGTATVGAPHPHPAPLGTRGSHACKHLPFFAGGFLCLPEAARPSSGAVNPQELPAPMAFRSWSQRRP